MLSLDVQKAGGQILTPTSCVFFYILVLWVKHYFTSQLTNG